jgi:cell division protein ZapA (FtsZ GTPase activity inhibitor)
MANVLRLDILGTSFTITADEDEEYLNKVLAQYREAVKNTQNISGIKDPLNIAILTGFLLCDEFNKVKEKKEKLESREYLSSAEAASAEDEEIEDRTLRLIAKLEQTLNMYGNEKRL